MGGHDHSLSVATALGHGLLLNGECQGSFFFDEELTVTFCTSQDAHTRTRTRTRTKERERLTDQPQTIHSFPLSKSVYIKQNERVCFSRSFTF